MTQVNSGLNWDYFNLTKTTKVFLILNKSGTAQPKNPKPVGLWVFYFFIFTHHEFLGNFFFQKYLAHCVWYWNLIKIVDLVCLLGQCPCVQRYSATLKSNSFIMGYPERHWPSKRQADGMWEKEKRDSIEFRP